MSDWPDPGSRVRHLSSQAVFIVVAIYQQGDGEDAINMALCTLQKGVTPRSYPLSDLEPLSIATGARP